VRKTRQAAAQLKVIWKPTPTRQYEDVETALRAHPSTPRTLIDKGDVDAALAAAAIADAKDLHLGHTRCHGSVGPPALSRIIRRGAYGSGPARKNPHSAHHLALLLQRPEPEIEVIGWRRPLLWPNCADDVSADASSVARRSAPSVRVQLTPRTGARLGAKGRGAAEWTSRAGCAPDGSVAGYDFATR